MVWKERVLKAKKPLAPQSEAELQDFLSFLGATSLSVLGKKRVRLALVAATPIAGSVLDQLITRVLTVLSMRMESSKFIKDLVQKEVEAERPRALNAALDLLDKDKDGLIEARLQSCFAELKPDEQSSFMREAAAMTVGISGTVLRLALIEVLWQTLPKRRQALVNHIKPLLPQLIDGVDRINVARVISEEPSMADLLHGITAPSEMAAIQAAVHQFPVAERLEAISCTRQVISRVVRATEVVAVLREFATLPQRERAVMAQAISLLLKESQDTHDMAKLMRVLKEIASDKRLEQATLFAKVLVDRDRIYHKMNIIKAALEIPESLALLADIETHGEREAIVDILRTCPADKRVGLAQGAALLLAGAKMPDGYARANLLRQLMVFEKLADSGLSPQDFIAMFKGIDDESTRRALLRGVRPIATSERLAIVRLAQKVEPKHRLNVFEMAVYIPAKYREAYFKLYVKRLEEDAPVQAFFSTTRKLQKQDALFPTDLLAHIEERLQALSADQELLSGFVRYMALHPKTFYLSGTPLMQKIAVILVTWRNLPK